MINKMERRTFMKSATAVSAFTILKPGTVFGTNANSAIRMGIIGCGGRGTAVISSMCKNTNAAIIAMADIFSDKLQAAFPVFNKLNAEKGSPVIPGANLYQGSKAYLSLLNNKDVDAVLISSPCYSHPGYIEAALAAGSPPKPYNNVSYDESRIRNQYHFRALSGEEITWEEMIFSNERLDPMLDLSQFDK